MNDLHSWKAHNLSRDLPVLQTVDITGAIFWVPDASLLKLPSLMEIIGVTWCKFCTNCTLVKPINILNETARREAAENCRERFYQYKYMQIGKPDPKRFVSYDFIPECMCVKETECEFRQLVMPYFENRESLPQYLFYLEYVISPFTILFNLIVLVVIVSRKTLRRTPSFFLIANMAFVDILVGIYSISVAEVNIKEIRKILEELMWTGQKLRPTTGPIFIAGQLISVLISSILTVERYIVVVYCVTSNLKLSMKATLISLAVAWGIAVTFAILPIFGVAGLHYNIKRACAPLSYDVKYQSQSSTVLISMLILIVLIYFLNIPLYVKIFRFVKKNTGKAVSGVKKEISLARKIATLILTNFVFFAIPIILILIISIFSEVDDNPFDFSGDAFESTIFKIVIGQWLPVTCLNINALLDPFLYAFRHSVFKQEAKTLVFRFTGKVLPLDDSCTANRTASKTAN